MQEKNEYNAEDQHLLDLFYKEGDNKWLGILLERYTLLLYGTCMKYLRDEEDAKDGVQQIFIKALTEISRNRIYYFRSWLYITARNYCLMKLRHKNEIISLTDIASPVKAGSEEKDDLLEKERQLGKLTEGFQLLSLEQQKCLKLFFSEKKSYIEIAEITGFSNKQIKSYIQNGKRKLRLFINQQSGEDEK